MSLRDIYNTSFIQRIDDEFEYKGYKLVKIKDSPYSRYKIINRENDEVGKISVSDFEDYSEFKDELENIIN